MGKESFENWTKEELIREIKKLKKRKKYGIVWEAKPEKVAELCKEKLPVLVEDKNKEIKTEKKEPINLLIEGDNYHALSVLNYTHKGKVDLIYIDPPYNTGSKSWKYNNDYVEKDDTFKHSKFLSFMEKRLKLAKNLLKVDGIIIVTIDSYEIFSLGLLLDEIFGEQNRLGILTIEHNPRGRSDDKFFATCHEYALYYAKNSKNAVIEKLDLTPEQAEAFFLKDEISNYRLLPLKRSGSNSRRTDRPNLWFPIYYDPTTKSGSVDKPRGKGFVEIWPIDGKGIERVWRWGKETVKNNLGTEIVFKEANGKLNVFAKDRIKEGRRPKTIWSDPKYDASSHGTILLEKILQKNKAFDYPKSLYAVNDCIKIVTKKKREATVLDFFAGSGTTGHAVLKLNLEDGGKRKFILCTNNENNICTDICYPRLSRVIEEIKNSEGEESVNSKPGNLKYFKTDFVDAEPTDINKKKLVDKSTEMLCLREDCFDFVKKGKFFRIFSNGWGKNLGIIYDDEGINPFKKEIRKLNKNLVVYVFSLDESAREEEFEDVSDLVQLKPIPAVILSVYKRIFK